MKKHTVSDIPATMNDMLDIGEQVSFEESVTRYQWHTFSPFVTNGSYETNDEIRIAANSQDMQSHPGNSYIYLEGTITTGTSNAVTATANAPAKPQRLKSQLINNAMAHLFSEIRYELNGLEVDSVRNVGVATTLKALASLDPSHTRAMENACLISEPKGTLQINGKFNFLIPLKHFLGFAEDYRRIVINMKQELVLIRSQNDSEAIVQEDGEVDTVFKIKLEKISWRLPLVELDDRSRLHLLNILQRDQPISMPFRSWECVYYPQLPVTDRQSWSVKLTNSLEKPRYVILAFQTKRRGNVNRNSSVFDHCNIRNVKLFLNGETFPYDDLNVNINENSFAMLYEMYTQFQTSYYQKEYAEPLLLRQQFKESAPIIIIDCSRQKDTVKSSSVDVRLEFTARENFPADTCAYCLIIHDRVVQYTPSDGVIKRMV